jgi:hypothetical protein
MTAGIYWKIKKSKPHIWEKTIDLSKIIKKITGIKEMFFSKYQTIPDKMQSEIQEENIEVNPPWIQYPNNPPYWGGWRQGYSEGWFVYIWWPFWTKLTKKERMEYLKKWPPPDEEWVFYMNELWTE